MTHAKRGRDGRLALGLLLTAVAGLAACGTEDGDPLAPEAAETAMGEAALDQAVAEAVELEQTFARRGPRYGHGLGGWEHGGQGNGSGFGQGHQGHGYGHGNGYGQGQHGIGPIPDVDHAELAVALAEEAVALATTILDEQGAGEVQAAFLAEAQEDLVEAGAALTEGDDIAAARLANRALWTALKAVVLPGPIAEDEVQAVYELAAQLMEDARTAVGDDPGDLEAHLLYRAEHLFEHGEAALERGFPRGVAALWKASVIAAYLAG